MASTPPNIRLAEYDLSFVSPSGVRHLQLAASGFVQNLGTAGGDFLNFGSINITNGKQSSATKAVLLTVDNLNDATEAVFNIRFHISDLSDWTTGTFFFNGFPSGQYFQNLSITDASGQFVPTTLPSGQNWWRDAGGPFNRDSTSFQEITASGADDQVTQWFYLSVTTDTDVTPKVYGGNSGGFVYRCTFDYR